MTLYILDTDHVSWHQREDPAIVKRLATAPPEQVFTTIISFEEQLRGWLEVNKKAQTPERSALAYTSLRRMLNYFCRINILDYTAAAAAEFVKLRAQRIRIGSQDLRIAAIALSVSGTVVTRNAKDFSQVPGLTVENWVGSNT